MELSAVCVPMEDTVQALIDQLVLPLLPAKTSTQTPSLERQESVAKQMHAVVLLYNYYHRKRFPHLEFLDAESFCKMAAIARPSLLMHMKHMKGDHCDSSDPEAQFSITEKMIVDACSICMRLEGQDVNSIEGWPVAKVAVFLVDSMKKNCVLQFSTITQGVWSLIEKDLDVPYHAVDSIILEMKNTIKRRKTTKRSTGDERPIGEALFQQQAFSAVKECTGIDQTDLTILKSHYVYSLSKEKTAARLYLMQCTKSFNEEVAQVPIEDAIHSTKGPVVKQDIDTSVTSVVDYLHLLPYAGILSEWFLQVEPITVCEKLSPNIDEPCTTQDNDIGYTADSAGQAADILDNVSGSSKTEMVTKKENENCYMRLRRSSGSPCKPKNMTDASSSRLPVKHSLSKDGKKNVENPIPQMHSENRKTVLIPCGLKANKNGSKNKVMVDSATKACGSETRGAQLVDGNNTCENGFLLQDRMPRNDHHLASFEGKACKTGTCEKLPNWNGICDKGMILHGRMPRDYLSVVPHQNDSQDLVDVPVMLPLKENYLLETAVQALKRKRKELSHQQRELEDEIARCNRNLLTIGTEGHADLMSKIVLEAFNDAWSKEGTQSQVSHSSGERQIQYMKRRRLSEAILNLQNPGQELDDICSENNWILPRYIVSVSNGGFLSTVTVAGLDFEFSVSGSQRDDPCEARESAAVKMLAKLRGSANQPSNS